MQPTTRLVLLCLRQGPMGRTFPGTGQVHPRFTDGTVARAFSGRHVVLQDLPPPPRAPPLPREPCPVRSYNDWDPLEEVILGRAEGARTPNLGPEVKAAIRPEKWAMITQHAGLPFQPEVVKKAELEAEELQRILELEGVTVRRPEIIDYPSKGTFKTPTFEEGGFMSSCPRDSLLVIGNEIIQAAMSWRARAFEGLAYNKLLNEYFKRGAKWTQAPQPARRDNLYKPDFPYEDMKKRLELNYKGEFILTEAEPCFDAADVLRLGGDIFVQLSQATNWGGYRWLQRHLAPNYRVHHLTFKHATPFHIDATWVPLKPGLMLVNPDRPALHSEFFIKNGWDLVEIPRPVAVNRDMLYASAWLSGNLLSLDEERVIVYSQEQPLIKLLRKYGLKPIEVVFKNAVNLGGGFHCWTCDIRRRGEKQTYFDKFEGFIGE